MEELKFSRQFLFSPIPCKKLLEWKQEKLDNNILYVHPSCGLFRAQSDDVDVILIGHAINPHFSALNEIEIIKRFTDAKSSDEVHELLYPLVGRFVLFFKLKDELRIYHDACGLHSVHYKFDNDGLYAASQPGLLKLATSLTRGNVYNQYVKSKYVAITKEHFLPAGISLYEGVSHLVPNHYLHVSSKKQIRFWPIKKKALLSEEFASVKIADILQNTMLAANQKSDLLVTITAGIDSRLIMAACKGIKKDVNFYTFQYRSLNKNSTDLKIPAKITSDLGLKYHQIDCRKPLNNEFINLYAENNDLAHVDDWGHIAWGMFDFFKSNDLAVKGNCVEIGRGIHLKDLPSPELVSFDFLIEREYLWNSLDFIVTRMKEWHHEVHDIVHALGYDELDLFYMEHRMGNWQAQSQLEWGMVHEALTPFNNRELIDLMLSVPAKYRMKPDFVLFTNVIDILWPELLNYPINPKIFSRIVRDNIRRVTDKFGVLNIVKKAVNLI